MNTFGTVYMSTVGCGIVYGRISGSSDPITTTAPDSNVMWGDVDVNGFVELTDAILLARAVGGDSGSSLSVQGRINAAVAGNAQLSAADTAKLLKYLGGSITLAQLAP